MMRQLLYTQYRHIVVRSGRWPAWTLALGLLGLLLFVGTPTIKVTGEETAVAPSHLTEFEHLAALSCEDTPFSRVIEVGGDYEMFVSFADAPADEGVLQNRVAGLLFDFDAGTEEPAQERILYDQTFWGEGPTSLFSPPVVTAVDFNGNGHTDFVQIYAAPDANANDQTKGIVYQQLADGSTVISQWQDPSLNYHKHAVTSGDFNRSNNNKKEVAVVSTHQTLGTLQVSLLLGSPTSGFAFGGGLAEPWGRWRTIEDNRSFPTFIDIANGDLNGNGFDDQIVVAIKESGSSYAQIIVLEFDPSYQSGDGSNFKHRLREIASARFEINEVAQFKVAVGDFNGDYHSEIALVTAGYLVDSPGLGGPIRARFFNYDLTNPAQPQIIERAEWLRAHQVFNLVATAADTDADGRDELVIVYYGAGDAGLYLTTLNAEHAESGTVVVHNDWYDNSNFRNEANYLSLAVANLTRIDPYKEIVLAFRDSGGRLQLAALADSQIPGQGITLLSAVRDPDTSLRDINRNISLALGDWDNDSLKAHYEPAPGADLLCKQVLEPQITAAVFVPPFWQNMQGAMSRQGSIGESKSTSKTEETVLTNFRSHSVSGYFGAGAGGEVLGIGVESSIRLTAGYDYHTSSSKGSSYTQGQTTSESASNANNFLRFETNAYNCFHYQLKQTNEPLDAGLRFCEYLGTSDHGANLHSWDRDNSPLTRADAYQWAPMARDWADLTLFRGAFTAQSSTAFGGVASRAVDMQLDMDGNFDGVYAHNSVTHTAYENQPWWQVDLGAVHPLEKVRLWNRTDAGCGDIHCSQRLANFYLFVSEVDFRQISNDPNVLRQDPRVRTYTMSDINDELGMSSAAGRVTTFQTMRQEGSQWLPVNGRYVRVQLAGAGILSLAEVQVFGSNHVEPDRYPVQVIHSSPPSDNHFEMRLYNPITGQYEWVTVRGKLQWNGRDHGVLKNYVVGPGEEEREWSIYTEEVKDTIHATSSSHAMRVGTEFDFQGGVVANVQFGASYEWTTGLTSDYVRIYSWGTGFEMGGIVTGFPSSYSGQTWINECKYRLQPFVYEIVEESSFGYSHRFPVLDYIVPGEGQGEGYLKRGSQALESCRQGEFVPANFHFVWLPLVTRP